MDEHLNAISVHQAKVMNAIPATHDDVYSTRHYKKQQFFFICGKMVFPVRTEICFAFESRRIFFN